MYTHNNYLILNGELRFIAYNYSNMNTTTLMPSWSLLQSFAAVAEHGSLSAAARAIAISQPTLSRHISELENSIGQRLFVRTVSGLRASPEGERLIKYVETMNEAAHNLVLQAGSKSESLSGTVRLTASKVVATYILPDILSDLKELEPNIVIELVASDKTDNLLRREADIAIRMYRPTQADVITKKLGELQIGIFASHSYIEKNGRSITINNLSNHKFIGYDRSSLIIDGFKHAGLDVNRDFFAFRSDDQVVCWQMVTAGLGIGFIPLKIGDSEPCVARLEANISIEGLPIWLTAHSELKSSHRVRFVYDFLTTRFNEMLTT